MKPQDDKSNSNERFSAFDPFSMISAPMAAGLFLLRSLADGNAAALGEQSFNAKRPTRWLALA